MNDAAFQELVQKADRAKKLCEEIKELQASDPLAQGVQCSFTKQGKYVRDDLLRDCVLEKVIAVRREKLIADKESELEAILNPQSADPTQLLRGIFIDSGLIAPTDIVPTGFEPSLPIQKQAGVYATEAEVKEACNPSDDF